MYSVSCLFIFLLLTINNKASWRSSFTVVNKALMPKYRQRKEVLLRFHPRRSSEGFVLPLYLIPTSENPFVRGMVP